MRTVDLLAPLDGDLRLWIAELPTSAIDAPVVRRFDGTALV
jgi:hypothetical protein